MLTYEDFNIGRRFEMGPKTVTEAEIIGFARKYDPQPFHTDPGSDMAESVGGLIASGWHTCAMQMRMMCDGYLRDSTSMGAPSLDEIRWLRPVRPGDVLTGSMEVLDRRVSKSRPSMGLLTIAYEMRNQNDEVVMTMRGVGLMGVREAA